MQDRFLEKKYFECKNLFFGQIQPIEVSDSEDTLSGQLDTLKEKVYGLTAENKLLSSELDERVKKTRRINKIINLIEERTHYGKEELVEKKIREMFNGLTQ
jgi:predicted nuclease with TOPRIM domain